MKQTIMSLSIIFCFIFITCSDLEHTNPADSKFILEAPTNLNAEAIDDQSIQLNWTDNCEFESGYSVERNDGIGFINITELNADVTTYKDGGLTYGQSYSYRVKAYTGQNESDYSNETYIEIIIPAPSDLTAEAIDDQSIQLTWTDNCKYELGYRIERNDGSDYAQVAEVSDYVPTWTDGGLTYGQSYSYRVKAYTDQNESDYSNESNTVEMIIPAPSGLTVTIIDDNSLQLTWTDRCSFESGFKVERKEESGEYSEIADLSANSESYIDQGLIFGINYIYRIRAYTNSNISNYSEELITNVNVVIDIDGNIYQAVKIGDQYWMAENLKVTKYRNGEAIPKVTDTGTWTDDGSWAGLSTGAYCNFDNNDSNTDTYGSLYNWYAVDDSRIIAPEGWHVPTDAEWKYLEMHLGMSYSEVDNTGRRGTNEGDKLKSTSGWNSNGNGTDDYGFAALPAGLRGWNGDFNYIGGEAYFWSASKAWDPDNPEYSYIAWYRHISYSDSGVYRRNENLRNGLSVRCVRD